MPGAYAHITIVNQAKETARLEAAGVPADAINAVLKYFKYCELGAVGPDYPYLGGASKWADRMHYEQTGAVIGAGIRRLASLSGNAHDKCLAWLLGYAAHVATDLTIHPVVELKVGSYHGNERAHRICEMHQDAHIFPRLGLGDIGVSEHLDSGIRRCSIEASEALDPAICDFWKMILQDVYQEAFATDAPKPEAWHKGFVTIVDAVEESGRLFPWARHVAAGIGATYPLPDEVDAQYIVGLEVPGGRRMHYDAIFDKALGNVIDFWRRVALDRTAPGDSLFAGCCEWNLDTGRDGTTNSYLFWS